MSMRVMVGVLRNVNCKVVNSLSFCMLEFWLELIVDRHICNVCHHSAHASCLRKFVVNSTSCCSLLEHSCHNNDTSSNDNDSCRNINNSSCNNNNTSGYYNDTSGDNNDTSSNDNNTWYFS